MKNREGKSKMDINELIHHRRHLHEIPELGFQEYKTQEYLWRHLSGYKESFISMRKWKTAILLRIEGKNPAKTIGYRADMDGLPIKEETGYPFSSKHPENMHACGHDFHMTIALGIIDSLIKDQPNDHVVFLFQPAEEGPGGALPMLEENVFEEWKPDIIFALHIAPELPVGTVSTRAGLLFANTSELFIDFKGKGGHAAYPHLTRDMVVAASNFVTQLQSIVSRKIDPGESAVVTIGKITGGFVQNVIAEEAKLEGTIRTLNPASISVIKKEIEQLAAGVEVSNDCKIQIDYGSNYYQVFNNEVLVNRFRELMESENIHWHEASPAMTGEDFGYMLKEIPGLMFWLGVNSEYGLHNSKLNPDESAILTGIKAAEKLIRKI